MAMFELLNAAQIAAALTDSARKQLMQLEILASIDSTNTYLLNKAKISTGYVCLAEQQTAGRGRRNNKPWHSPFGKNIYLSLCWHFPTSQQLTGLSIAIGVAVANALINYGIPSIDLKWPNDIWYQRQKLAGILVEIVREAEQGYRAIIGVGVNVNLSNESNCIDQPWTDIATIIAKLPQRNLLVSYLLNELFSILPLFANAGLVPFLSQWQRYDVLLNKLITIQQQQEQLTGIAVGIDHNGNLLVDFAGVTRSFFSGEVSIRF